MNNVVVGSLCYMVNDISVKTEKTVKQLNFIKLYAWKILQYVVLTKLQIEFSLAFN